MSVVLVLVMNVFWSNLTATLQHESVEARCRVVRGAVTVVADVNSTLGVFQVEDVHVHRVNVVDLANLHLQAVVQTGRVLAIHKNKHHIKFIQEDHQIDLLIITRHCHSEG